VRRRGVFVTLRVTEVADDLLPALESSVSAWLDPHRRVRGSLPTR